MARIEYHPENGPSPWVVICGEEDGLPADAHVWVAYPDSSFACVKLQAFAARRLEEADIFAKAFLDAA